jgi:hypothetical protein
MSLVERHGGAGGSAARKYKKLARSWRRQTFGIRAAFLWLLAGAVFMLARTWTPLHWQFIVGFLLGATIMGAALLPEALLPDHIRRWERGAWGEQNTAKALKRLKKEGWRIRHDLATHYGSGNRDHVAVGPAVYLLDSKLLKDKVWLEGDVLHVERLDESGDTYRVTDLNDQMSKATWSLKQDLDAAVGFPVAVYPVVVVWGNFDAGSDWAGEVAYVAGEQIAEWLRSRPVDIHDEKKREAIFAWLDSLPRA